jgi:anti-sigma regulatory factor (Ser/Thr protein kinase)
LYNGGHGAFFYIDPDKMNVNQQPPTTMITALQVNGKPYPLYRDNPAKFRSYQNDIAIAYTSVDLTNGAETKYAYKLMGGKDTGWSMPGKLRQINFSRLAAGNYVFMVRSLNGSGVWSTEPASISFYIRTPFTQTIWFYSLILLVMAGVFYAMYRFRLRQLTTTEQIRSEISRNLHDEVGSTLTNISLTSLLAKKQLPNEGPVHRILDRIYEDSQSVSEAMRDIVWSINPKIDTLGESLPRMLRYSSELLEAEDIEVKAEIASDIEQVKLTMQQRRDLYMIFKEAVNNLAKHSKATEVSIRFHLVNNKIVMIIADNGVGFDMNAPLINNGLRNMRERAKNHRWLLHLLSEPGAGTTITLTTQIA